MRNYWPLIGLMFVVVSVAYTVLAWDGANVPLVLLGATSCFSAVGMAYNGLMWRRALDGWNRSNDGWAKANQYLRDYGRVGE